MNEKTNKPMFEKAVYPAEFLDCLAETAFQTLHDYLNKAGAPFEVIDLLDCAAVLAKESRELYHNPEQQLHRATNELLTQAVSDASQEIAALGGVFHAPNGTSVPRDSEPFKLAADELRSIQDQRDLEAVRSIAASRATANTAEKA